MKRLAVALTMMAMVACESPPSTGGKGQPPKLDTKDDGTVLPIDHPPVDWGTGGGTGTGGGGEGGGVPATLEMATRRLSVAQARASMEVVLGGSTWMVGSVNGFQSRGASLGQADYISITDENLEPSPLYAKFMADAARDGCTRAGDADASRPQASRVLARFAGPADTVTNARANIDANLRYLKLRFHGVKVAPTDDVAIAGYRTLFDDAAKAGDVKEGWRAVCVALLTAPEYHLY